MIGIPVVLIVLVSGSIGLLCHSDPYDERAIHQLIDTAYSHQRPGGGRLSAAIFSPAGDASFKSPDLGKAQLLLLRQPDSAVRQRLQGSVYLAAGEWQQFLDLANDPSITRDSALQNNLGISFLALSERNPTLLLKA